MAKPTGIRVRHASTCPARDKAPCRCTPSYEAWAWSQREGRKIRKTCHRYAEAKSWRADAVGAIRKGALSTPTRQTLEQAAETWLEKIERGEVLSRNRTPYKPSTVRTYRRDLERYVYGDLGARRLSELGRRDFQALVDRLVRSGLSGPKVRNVIVPL